MTGTDSPALLEAFGAYTVQRLEEGQPCLGAQSTEILAAFRFAFQAGFDFGANG